MPMKSLTKENVMEALRAVHDPDLRKDIVTLGFVKDVAIRGSEVSFAIELTTPACPVRDELKSAAANAVKAAIEGCGDVTVTMTSNVGRHAQAPRAEILRGVRNTIAVASGKGGVGKSTIAANLAVALALDGARVGLADLDMYGPSMPLMMGLHRRPVQNDGKIIPLENWGVRVMSIGFLVDPMQAVVWRGPMVSGAVRQFMADVEWGDLDYLVMDLPPGTGDVQLTLVQTIPLTGAVVVTTPQDIALADALKAWKMFEKVDVPVLGVVENMSYYICSHCGAREEIFANGGGRKTAEELGVPFLGDVPLHTSIRVSGDRGTPIAADPAAPVQAGIIRTIARNVAAQVSIRNAERTSGAPLSIELMEGETG
ncbi:MAG TPA: iron-sulfur cluster carrier protein ApbC [Bacteroidota bacterium]|nr:iron-sulfur cluster carrier protein ApbC [Bacteroidota bacterium]